MSAKKKILFVDDDRNLLDALRRSLGSQRVVWEMVFADGGKKGLEVLSSACFDLVVSDIRMPEMDGVAFLTEVKNRYPSITRIALSGYAENEMIKRVTNLAHQFLSKPCQSKVLVEVIQRACSLRDLLAYQHLLELIPQFTLFPMLTSLADTLWRELSTERPSMQSLCEIISSDPAMSARVLHLVNSEFFGHHKNIASIDEAVALLGVETLQNLLLAIDAFTTVGKHVPSHDPFLETWKHSLITAVFARQIANSEPNYRQFAGAAFSAGLLHDFGVMLLQANLPKRYEEILRLSRATGRSICDVEHDVLGTDHGAIGAYLLGLWGLPHPIVEAVAYHHHPSECASAAFSPLAAVYLAQVVSEMNAPADSCKEAEIDEEYLSMISADKHLNDWKALCSVTIEEKLDERLRTLVLRTCD